MISKALRGEVIPLANEPVPSENPNWNACPYLVIWEVTRRCTLACRHCRASAHPRPDRFELSTQEGKQLLQQIADLGPKLVVLTGGDPFHRPDLLDLVRHATGHLGLKVALSPSATPALLEAPLADFVEAGVRRISLSLDAATEARHDAFRGIRGTWRRTLTAVAKARGVGLEVQINSTVGGFNADEFPAMAGLMREINPVMWNLFFLVPTGRAQREATLGPEATERILEHLADLQQEAPFAVKTTEAPAVSPRCPTALAATGWKTAARYPRRWRRARVCFHFPPWRSFSVWFSTHPVRQYSRTFPRNDLSESSRLPPTP